MVLLWLIRKMYCFDVNIHKYIDTNELYWYFKTVIADPIQRNISNTQPLLFIPEFERPCYGYHQNKESKY